MFKKMKNKILENLIISTFCLFGALYVILFFNKTVIDVPVSDYIRIINYYYEDVFDLKFLFSMECISRVPITFLMRIINVVFFNFSTNFDRAISLLGLVVFNFILLKYIFKIINKTLLKILCSIMITFTSFSLMHWEMILNGTAYPHYLSLALFMLCYYMFDNYYNESLFINNNYDNKQYEKKNLIRFFILMPCSALLFGGAYQVAFLFTLSAFCSIFFVINCFVNKDNNIKQKMFNTTQFNNVIIIVLSIFCVSLYQISNNTGEPLTHVGMKDVSLTEVLASDITFPIRFLLKSLASTVIGVDNIATSLNIGLMTDKNIYIFAILFLIAIVFVFIIIIINKYYIKYIFPLLLLFHGLVNYLFIFFARYKFLNDTYGMSSRYGIQYMFLTLSMIIFLFKIIDDEKTYVKTIIINGISIAILLCLLSGNLTTNYHEWILAPFRRESYEKAKNIALNIDSYKEGNLEDIFEYHRGEDQIVKAFDIIKKNNLNIFNK